MVILLGKRILAFFFESPCTSEQPAVSTTAAEEQTITTTDVVGEPGTGNPSQGAYGASTPTTEQPKTPKKPPNRLICSPRPPRSHLKSAGSSNMSQSKVK